MLESYNNLEFISINSEIIERFVDKYNEENSCKIKSINNIDIFMPSMSIKVLQFQPKEVLEVVTDNKLSSKNYDNYVKKYNAFFDKSFEKKYSLVLTPEYSVPRKSFDYFIRNIKKIKSGSLYCLCCEGMTYSDFEEISNSLADKKSIHYYDIALKSSFYRETVCVMFYVTTLSFELENREIIEEIFVIPQFKLNPMKDTYFEYEKSGLSQGNKILYWGKENSDKFLSLICADIYNLDVIKKIQEFGKNEILIFNPQLNLGAENKIFCFIREYLFDYCKNKIRIINLNWARNTELILNDESSYIINPWSGIYFNFDKKEFEKVLKNFPNNVYWGLDLGVDNNMGFWFTNPKEHILSYKIDGFDVSNNPKFTIDNVDLVAEDMFIFNEEEKKFVIERNVCKESIDEFFYKNDEFNLLNGCSKCAKNNCTKCNLNKFSALIFDNNLLAEYDMFYDGDFIGIASRQYYSDSNEKIVICKRIMHMLKCGNVSERFKNLDRNFKFIIENIKGNDYNVVFKDATQEDVYCRVVYLKYKELPDVKRKYSELVSKYGRENRNNIMIFYEAPEECKVFPEFNDKSIVDDEDSAGNKIVND